MYRLLVLFSLLSMCNAFTVPLGVAKPSNAFVMPLGVAKPYFVSGTQSIVLRMSEPEKASTEVTEAAEGETDPMEEEELDAEALLQLEKQRRADELRSQEVFMTKSTGKHKCNNCDWEYDQEKGDKNMIGGMVAPGTTFEELAANWRCPVCRASKDNFSEVVEEIPGFEVNQGYGLGTNAWTSGQKNLAIFGGLGVFFVLFLSGYAMS